MPVDKHTPSTVGICEKKIFIAIVNHKHGLRVPVPYFTPKFKVSKKDFFLLLGHVELMFSMANLHLSVFCDTEY